MLRRRFEIQLSAFALLLALGCGSAATDADSPSTTALDAADRRTTPPPGCVTQVNADGFGDPSNRWAWSMKAFGDHLYVGTLNRGSGATSDDPDLAGPVAASEQGTTGTQIWRHDGAGWQQVVGNGFGNRFNLGVRNFVVYRDALYAATHNPATGAEVWRSSDGAAWSRVGEPGLGDRGNVSVRGAVVWRKQLWLGTANARGAEVWSFDGTTWRRVVSRGVDDVGNHTVGEIVPAGDQLFIAAWNARGARVYRFDGSAIVPVVGGFAATAAGFGDPGNVEILSMAVFGDALYASTGNPRSGFAVWRTRDLGASWQPVLTGGDGDPSRAFGWRLFPYGEQLYLGTYTSADADTNTTRRGALLYRTKDGSTWVQEVGPRGKLAPAGFGDARNLGIRGLESFFGDLYVGTAQCYGCASSATGAEVWRRAADACKP